jgi:hypothetical protein
VNFSVAKKTVSHICLVVKTYILSAFTKLRKATIKFVMSVCLPVCLSFCLSGSLSVCMERLVSHWTDCREICYLNNFRKFVEKFNFYENLTRITGTSLEDLFIFMIISRWIILKMRNFSDKFVEKIKTHFIFYKLFFFGNRAVCEMTLKNILVLGGPQMTI